MNSSLIAAGRYKAVFPVLVMLLCVGCSTTTSRNVASYIFDGIPAPPQPDVYCAPWLAAKQGQATSGKTGAKVSKPQGSVHPPYKEKQCRNCHDTNKTGGLIAPLKELCFICHDTIVKKTYSHAPAASGSCLSCHLPHDSAQPSLLRMEKTRLCVSCHVQHNVAQALHQRVAQANILCTDCHNPHAGDIKYFLK